LPAVRGVAIHTSAGVMIGGPGVALVAQMQAGVAKLRLAPAVQGVALIALPLVMPGGLGMTVGAIGQAGVVKGE